MDLELKNQRKHRNFIAIRSEPLQALCRMKDENTQYFFARNTHTSLQLHICGFTLQQVSIVSSAADANSDCRLFKTTISARNLFFICTLV